MTLKILKVSVGPTFCGEKHLEMPKLALSLRGKQRTALEESQNSITLRLCRGAKQFRIQTPRGVKGSSPLPQIQIPSYPICPDRIKCAEKPICVYNQSPMPGSTG